MIDKRRAVRRTYIPTDRQVDRQAGNLLPLLILLLLLPLLLLLLLIVTTVAAAAAQLMLSLLPS